MSFYIHYIKINDNITMILYIMVCIHIQLSTPAEYVIG